MVFPALARLAWQVGEPLHALSYFGGETRAATDALGLHGGWQSYFGCRAAPLGRVTAAAVGAIFYGFAPAMVERAVPNVWSRATPEQLLEARLAAAGRELGRVLPGDLTGDGVRRAAGLAWSATGSVLAAGRPLGAANAALEEPAEPHLVLWQALTTLREHRGDSHVAVLLTSGVDPCSSHVLAAASGRAEGATLRRLRGFSEEDWAAAQESLQARGWLDPGGALTADGRAGRQRIEELTDELAAAAYDGLGERLTTELVEELRPLADHVMTRAGIPVPNPIGLPWPPDAG